MKFASSSHEGLLFGPAAGGRDGARVRTTAALERHRTPGKTLARTPQVAG